MKTTLGRASESSSVGGWVFLAAGRPGFLVGTASSASLSATCFATRRFPTFAFSPLSWWITTLAFLPRAAFFTGLTSSSSSSSSSSGWLSSKGVSPASSSSSLSTAAFFTLFAGGAFLALADPEGRPLFFGAGVAFTSSSASEPSDSAVKYRLFLSVEAEAEVLTRCDLRRPTTAGVSGFAAAAAAVLDLRGGILRVM